MEIERKWMVTGWPEGLTQTSDYQMDQGYVSVRPTVRIRREALQGLAPDAHRGAHADVALIHLIVRGLGQPLRPARDHPFAFDFHNEPLPPCRGRTCPALNLSVIAAMPYSSGPGMPGPYGVYCHKLYHNLFPMPSLQCCQFSTKNFAFLSSNCHLHFAGLPRIIEA